MNKILYFPLQIYCPPQCICQSKQLKNQTHSSCQTQLFINQLGDVFCQNYLNGEGCQPTFIKEFCFQCEKAKKNGSFYKFMSLAVFMMTLAQAFQSLELHFTDDEIVYFQNKISSITYKRWKL